MSNPIPFLSTTPRFALPLLFVGQAQKEVTVNEAIAVADLLLHTAVEAELDQPPAAPVAGQVWLVGPQPSGSWAGCAGSLAGWSEGGWRMIPPRAGMRIFDRSRNSFRVFVDGWRSPSAPSLPTGGSLVDVEARKALADVFSALSAAGILAAPKEPYQK